MQGRTNSFEGDARGTVGPIVPRVDPPALLRLHDLLVRIQVGYVEDARVPIGGLDPDGEALPVPDLQQILQVLGPPMAPKEERETGPVGDGFRLQAEEDRVRLVGHELDSESRWRAVVTLAPCERAVRREGRMQSLKRATLGELDEDKTAMDGERPVTRLELDSSLCWSVGTDSIHEAESALVWKSRRCMSCRDQTRMG